MRKSVALWSAILLLGLTALGGCRPAGGEFQIATDLNELSLASLWTRIAEATDFQEETARLSSLRLSVAADGPLWRLHLVFHALNEGGRNVAYFADMGRDGELQWREQRMERGEWDYPAQPAEIMALLDGTGLAGVAAEKGGMTVSAGSQAGSLTYSSEYTELYLLENGHRRPLEEIVFDSDSPWITITMCAEPAETEEDREVMETDFGVLVTRTIRAGESGDCEVWFPEQAVTKADRVEPRG